MDEKRYAFSSSLTTSIFMSPHLYSVNRIPIIPQPAIKDKEKNTDALLIYLKNR